MASQHMASLREAAQKDPALGDALAGAESAQQWLDIANAHGFAVEASDLEGLATPAGELSDQELEGAAGGTYGPTVMCLGPTLTICRPGS